MRSPAMRAHPLVFGVVVFLASESMLFAGLLAAWFDLRGQTNVWPPAGAILDAHSAAFGTVLLGLGSILMGVAQYAATRKQRMLARGMLTLTIFCALSFVYIALRDWATENFRVDSNAYGTLFYVLTGTHLAHVLVGAVLILSLIVFYRRPAFEADHQAGVEAIAYYWHFLFVIWLAIWSSIYVLR